MGYIELGWKFATRSLSPPFAHNSWRGRNKCTHADTKGCMEISSIWGGDGRPVVVVGPLKNGCPFSIEVLLLIHGKKCERGA